MQQAKIFRLFGWIVLPAGLFVGSIMDGYSAHSVPIALQDTLQHDARSFDESRIADFKDNAQFDYSNTRGKGVTLWQRFLQWLQELFMALFYVGSNTSIFKIVIYSLLTGALVFSILKLLNADPSKIIQKKTSKALHYEVTDENIHVIPFEEQIEKALIDKKFRLVVRLHYLYAIKILSDNGMIQWVPGKPNREYLYELQNDSIKSHLGELSRLFEYAWYGGFQVEAKIASQSAGTFMGFRKQLTDEVQG